MIKHLLFGLWICILTLGAAYGTVMWQAKSHEEAAAKEGEEKVVTEQVQTKKISVPIIANGVVKGYVLAQFVFRINAKILKEMTVRPDIFLVDEAFRVIYGGKAIDFRNPLHPDVAALSAMIKKNVNERFGENFVEDVLVQELTYIPQERFRGGALAGGNSFG